MATEQGFPQPDVPIADPAGNVSISWLHFFVNLWKRSGGADGNNSDIFPYPSAPNGVKGQVLTSQGGSAPSIWTTLANKLSQFTNDVGFITSSSLVGLTTTAQVDTQILTFASGNLSNTIPPPATANGNAGISTKVSRADHTHPTELNPVFTKATAAQFVTNGAFITAGNGAPATPLPNASLYLNTAGATGTRLYVSNGATWAAVPGV